MVAELQSLTQPISETELNAAKSQLKIAVLQGLELQGNRLTETLKNQRVIIFHLKKRHLEESFTVSMLQ